MIILKPAEPTNKIRISWTAAPGARTPYSVDLIGSGTAAGDGEIGRVLLVQSFKISMLSNLMFFIRPLIFAGFKTIKIPVFR